MAKNTITEEDLLAGVGGLGSFNKLGTGKPIRDNPFRDTKVVEKVVEVETQRVKPLPSNQGNALVSPQAEKVESFTEKKVLESQTRPKVEIVPKAEPSLEAKIQEPKKQKKEKKSDLYSEKISTFLSSEMRDDLTISARKLNSNRLVKGDPITMHTLLRCGVRVVTELLEFGDSDVVSSEEELMALVERKLKASS